MSRTRPKITNEELELIFEKLDDSLDFKVFCFLNADIQAILFQWKIRILISFVLRDCIIMLFSKTNLTSPFYTDFNGVNIFSRVFFFRGNTNSKMSLELGINPRPRQSNNKYHIRIARVLID